MITLKNQISDKHFERDSVCISNVTINLGAFYMFFIDLLKIGGRAKPEFFTGLIKSEGIICYQIMDHVKSEFRENFMGRPVKIFFHFSIKLPA